MKKLSSIVKFAMVVLLVIIAWGVTLTMLWTTKVSRKYEQAPDTVFRVTVHKPCGPVAYLTIEEPDMKNYYGATRFKDLRSGYQIITNHPVLIEEVNPNEALRLQESETTEEKK